MPFFAIWVIWARNSNLNCIKKYSVWINVNETWYQYGKIYGESFRKYNLFKVRMFMKKNNEIGMSNVSTYLFSNYFFLFKFYLSWRKMVYLFWKCNFACTPYVSENYWEFQKNRFFKY